MAERDYAYKVAKRSGGKQEMWDNYRKLKNLTNRKMKAAEALYYKKLIETAQGPKEMWRALNSALGNEKVENLTFQLQEGERIISEPKAVASKFNKFFATIGCRIAKKLFSYQRMPGRNTNLLSKLMMKIYANFIASVLKLFLRFCTH